MNQVKAVGIAAVLIIGVVLQINALPAGGGQKSSKAISELRSAFEAFLQQNQGENNTETNGMEHNLLKQDKVEEELLKQDSDSDEKLMKQDLELAETEELAKTESLRYRIRGGHTSLSGRVEVFFGGRWGTVCDDGFGVAEARVVCHSLGFSRVRGVYQRSYRYFGQAPSSFPIWLDDVDCRGDETELAQCAHLKFGSHNCNHNEDVGVYCGY